MAAAHGIGMIAPEALERCRWKDQLVILDTPNFRPAVRVWASSNPDTSKLIRPIDEFLTCIRSLADEGATNILAREVGIGEHRKLLLYGHMPVV